MNRKPIIALTAHAIKDYREKCLDHDMDDFITKPFKKKVLINTIEKWASKPASVHVVDDVSTVEQ